MARPRRSFIRSGRAVRETMWVGVGETNSTIAASSTALLINSGSAGLLALRPFTVVRTRGILAFRSDQTGVSEAFHAALGYSVVTDQASAIGITAVPTPYTDIGSDMFYVHQFFSGRFEFVTGVGFHPQSMQVKEYDSKAMRRVNDDSDVVTVLETSSLSSGINIYHAARFLIKLH